MSRKGIRELPLRPFSPILPMGHYQSWKHKSRGNNVLIIPVRRRSGERGQAILLVVLGMSIFVLGAIGLAIDGSHLYAQRQMAQAAADAAAQAGIMSIFDGTNGTGTHAFTASSTVTT